MRDLLDGAELIRYGAKTSPIGGLYAQPKLYVDGALVGLFVHGDILRWDLAAPAAAPSSGDALSVVLCSGETLRLGPDGAIEIIYRRELAAELHARDRVHTYGSFYIADLNAA